MTTENSTSIDANTARIKEAENVQVRSAVALSFAARLSSAVVTLISSMVIARLLTPAEMGVYAIGLTLKVLLDTFREFGVGNYLIQEKQLTREKVRAAFSVTLLLAWTAGGVLVVISEPAANFYKTPTLAGVILVIAISFFLLPFSAPALGLLRREFCFATLYQINVAANVATAVVNIILAMMGFGAMSMAWGVVAGAAVFTIFPCASRPSYALMMPTLRGWRPVLTFGGQSTFASIIAQLSESAMQLLIGRLLGLNALGLFNRAYTLLLFARTSVFGSLSSVAIPVMAANIRDGRDIREPYLRASGLLTGIFWPMQAFLLVMAFPLFRILYGPRWDAAVPLFQLLMLGDVAYTALAFVGPVLVAFGRVDYWARGETIVQAARLALIVPACFHSLIAVCIAEDLHYIFFLIVFAYILQLLMGVSFGKLAGAHTKSLLLAVFSFVGPGVSALAFGLGSERPLRILIVAGAGATTGWLLGVYLLSHDLRLEIRRAINWLLVSLTLRK
jgi:O-antigen/teichoic acid export membrane protein